MAVGFRVGVTEPHLRVAEENLKAHSHAPASAPRSPGAHQAGGGHAPGAVSCAKALQERRKGTRHPGRAGRPEFGEGFLPKGGTRASFRVCHWARERDSADPRMQTRNGGHRRRARGPVEGVGRGRGGAGAPGSPALPAGRRPGSRWPGAGPAWLREWSSPFLSDNLCSPGGVSSSLFPLSLFGPIPLGKQQSLTELEVEIL